MFTFDSATYIQESTTSIAGAIVARQSRRGLVSGRLKGFMSCAELSAPRVSQAGRSDDRAAAVRLCCQHATGQGEFTFSRGVIDGSLFTWVRTARSRRGMEYWCSSRKTKMSGGVTFMMGTLLRKRQSDTTQRGESAEKDSENRLSMAKKFRIWSGHSSSSFWTCVAICEQAPTTQKGWWRSAAALGVNSSPLALLLLHLGLSRQG